MPDIQSVVTWWAVDRMDLFVILVAGICFSRIFHRHAANENIWRYGRKYAHRVANFFFFWGGAFPKVSLPRCQ
jgi:hypothetical protein